MKPKQGEEEGRQKRLMQEQMSHKRERMEGKAGAKGQGISRAGRGTGRFKSGMKRKQSREEGRQRRLMQKRMSREMEQCDRV